uniref:Uncharacterized protein n=1 Tax=Romanomermis culicivorax TaxID=13658 RepID=A0A915JHN3_ROMCU
MSFPVDQRTFGKFANIVHFAVRTRPPTVRIGTMEFRFIVAQFFQCRYAQFVHGQISLLLGPHLTRIDSMQRIAKARSLTRRQARKAAQIIAGSGLSKKLMKRQLNSSGVSTLSSCKNLTPLTEALLRSDFPLLLTSLELNARSIPTKNEPKSITWEKYGKR